MAVVGMGTWSRPLDQNQNSMVNSGYTQAPQQNNTTPVMSANGRYQMDGNTGYAQKNSQNRYYPNYAPAQLPYLPGMSFSDNINDINKLESKTTGVNQNATNVFQGADQMLGSPLGRLFASAQMIQNAPVNLQDSLSLNRGFQGSNQLQNALSGGVDYFGRLGMSEGLQNLRAQENASNRALTAQLGRNPANASLIAALQNQNRMRTQLAYNPLMGEAQRGTYERAAGNIGLENQRVQLLNNLLGTEASFRNQSALSGLEARMAQLQPMMNYIEALTALQGQARGVSSTENVLGGKNYS